MASQTAISVRLDKDMKEALEKEAKQNDRSTSYIARRAIEEHIKFRNIEKQAIEDAIKQADRGEFISGKSMRDWVQSWGTDNELPEPKIDMFLKK